MGRTIPSYRIASEMEIMKWKLFRKALDKQDKKKFDDMLSIPHPVLNHVILMSIIFKHYQQLTKVVNECIYSIIASNEKK